MTSLFCVPGVGQDIKVASGSKAAAEGEGDEEGMMVMMEGEGSQDAASAAKGRLLSKVRLTRAVGRSRRRGAEDVGTWMMLALGAPCCPSIGPSVNLNR